MAAPSFERAYGAPQDDANARSVDRRLEPLGLGAVVLVAADLAVGDLGQDRARRRQVERSTWVAGSHSLERTIALAHWKNTCSTAITSTERGALPCMAKLAHSSGSVEIVARPMMRSVSLTPGIRNSSATRGSCDQVAQAVDAVVAAAVGHDEGLLVDHAHEALRIAARRAVEPVRAAGRQREERRGLDQRAVGPVMRSVSLTLAGG